MKKVSRRIFLASSAMGAMVLGGCASPGSRYARHPKSLKRMGYYSPNEKINCAGIGVGGKGSSDINKCADTENVIALCDPDARNAGGAFERYPHAAKYKDFRVMLDKQWKEIDACTISTPDHMHALIALWCMERGIHVYVQKPLVHNVQEARLLLAAKRKYNVKTQMGNQGHCSDSIREACEIIWSGMIGDVREVHAWTNRPIWPQGIKDPLPKEPIPEHIDWDLWLGVAQHRPYNRGYAPFRWRGWYDFGTGALGDMACHILDAACWSLQLKDPLSIETISQDVHYDETYPNKSIIRYAFARRGDFPPVVLTWYDGGNKPPRPAGVGEDEKLGDGDNGSYFVGSQGVMTTGGTANDTRVLGDLRHDYKKPIEVLDRTPGATHPDYNDNIDNRATRDWLDGIKHDREPSCNFEYACPFTEWILLGAISNRVRGKLLWDANQARFSNNDEANQYLTRDYRNGWELPRV